MEDVGIRVLIICPVLVSKSEREGYVIVVKKISLIVPCFNEQGGLSFFEEEVTGILSEIDYNYEVIFVNDGSRDNILPLLRDYATRNRHIKYLSFSKKFGKKSAMYAVFCNASKDYVAVMDADIVDGARDFRLMKRGIDE